MQVNLQRLMSYDSVPRKASAIALEVCTGRAAPGPNAPGQQNYKIMLQNGPGRAENSKAEPGRPDRPVILYVLRYFCDNIYISAYFFTHGNAMTCANNRSPCADCNI